MDKKESPIPRDDLKKIDGIGAATEVKLYDLGIVTYEQVATLSRKDIAEIVENLPGISLKRIKADGWQVQAKELAAQKNSSENGSHYAIFTVQLLLTKQNEVARTIIVNAKEDNRKTSWRGWDEARLINVLREDVRLVTGFDKVGNEEHLPTSENAQKQSDATKFGSIELLKGSDLIPTNKPFEIQTNIDIASLTHKPDMDVYYQLEIISRDVHTNQTKIIKTLNGIEEQGVSQLSKVCSIQLETPGTYKLETLLKLTSIQSKSFVQTVIPGAFVKIY